MILKKIKRKILSYKQKLLFRKDEFRLKRHDSIFKNYSSASKSIRENIKPVYEDYTANISSREMAVSLQTAVFLYYLSERKRPKRILDLGSGFSSYILRLYAQEQKENVEVYSIDDNNDWLDKTEEFLLSHKLPVDHLMNLDSLDFSSCTNSFDLVFHDLGNMNLRKKHLPDAVGACMEANGIVILDDIHKKDYNTFIKSEISSYECTYFNLDWITRDDFGRKAALITDINFSKH